MPNFVMSTNWSRGFHSGNGWVGWKKSSLIKSYVEAVFAFDEIRNFSAVHLFTNNFFSKEVQVRFIHQDLKVTDVWLV